MTMMSNKRDVPAELETYRYIRVALPALAMTLFLSVVIESIGAGGCWQSSISAYYYTPARGVFASALVAMGVCLYVLKGSTAWEDCFLDAAGILAAFVAFIPTKFDGVCGQTDISPDERDHLVANNVLAALIVGAMALIVALGVAIYRRRYSGKDFNWVRFAMSVALFLALGTGYADRNWLLAHGHGVCASAMFLFIIAVVVNNHRQLATGTPVWISRTYKALAGAMSLLLVITVALRLFHKAALSAIGNVPHHTTLVTEALLITIFAAFWVVESIDLLHHVTRPEPDAQFRVIA